MLTINAGPGEGKIATFILKEKCFSPRRRCGHTVPENRVFAPPQREKQQLRRQRRDFIFLPILSTISPQNCSDPAISLRHKAGKGRKTMENDDPIAVDSAVTCRCAQPAHSHVPNAPFPIIYDSTTAHQQKRALMHKNTGCALMCINATH